MQNLKALIKEGDIMKTKKQILKAKFKNNIPFYIMLTPFIVIFSVFMLIPACGGLLVSFTDFNGMTWSSFTGISNYTRLLFKDDTFLIVLKNTLLQAMIVGPVGFIMSFVVAWLINELGKGTRLLIMFLFYSPNFSGTLYVIWQYVFANDSNGLVNSALKRMGIESISWLSDSSYNMPIVILVSIWVSFGAGFLSFVAGLRGLDRAYYEAAAIDGLKNRWQELYYVTLPQMGPQLLFGMVQAIGGAFAVGAVNRAIAGYPSTDNATDTILLYMGEISSTRFEYGYASAMSVILMAIMLLIWKIVNKALRNFGAE